MKKYIFLILVFFLAELYLLILAGRLSGPGYTVAYVVFAAFAGMALSQAAGKNLKNSMVQKTRENRLPAAEFIDGAAALAGALLIIIPGILTDIAGVLLTIPSSRRYILKMLRPLAENSGFVSMFRTKLKEELAKKGFSF